MKPSSRHGVNKRTSASKFKRNISRTKQANVAGPSMRGGWRL